MPGPSPSEQVLHIPQRFHPAYSLLGRWIRKKTGDPHRAEALYIVAVTGIVVVLVLLQFTTWALGYPFIVADPTGPAALAYWGAQVGSFVLCFLCCALGFKPGFTVRLKKHHLEISQEEQTLHLPLDEIIRTRPLTATRYHRHYRHYAATRSFIGPPDTELLLLETTQGPVVLPWVAKWLRLAVHDGLPPVAGVGAHDVRPAWLSPVAEEHEPSEPSRASK